jgi:hypothetical protein
MEWNDQQQIHKYTERKREREIKLIYLKCLKLLHVRLHKPNIKVIIINFLLLRFKNKIKTNFSFKVTSV